MAVWEGYPIFIYFQTPKYHRQLTTFKMLRIFEVVSKPEPTLKNHSVSDIAIAIAAQMHVTM